MGPSALRRKEFERILLVKPSAVGDVIHTLPVLAKLRARYPAARIDWLLTPAIAELVRHHPALSHALLFPRQDFRRVGRGWAATARLVELCTAVRHMRYDLVIDLHGQFRSALFVLMTGAPVRIGFDRPRRARLRRPPGTPADHGWAGAREGAWVAYTHRIPIPTLEVHAVERYLWLGDLLGLDHGRPTFDVPVPPAAEGRVDSLLERNGVAGRSVAVLTPGTVWETKHWRADGFAEVGRHLLRRGLAVVLTGSAGERERCEAVAAGCPGACNLAGQTALTDLAALVRRAAVCVTNDSGSMHLAAALGRPVVSVFGPTEPVWVGPYGQPDGVVRAGVPCSPCYLRKLRACPHGHVCMTDVTADMVITRIDRVLAQSGLSAAG